MSKEIIEINGVKLEVDLTNARVVDEYHIGDVVKVLKKQYSDYKSFAGTIVGFDPFKNLPTIIIAYLNDYNTTIEFLYYNAESKDVEICMANPNDITFTKDTVVDAMNKDIQKKKAEITELEIKRDYFINHFSQCFGDTE